MKVIVAAISSICTLFVIELGLRLLAPKPINFLQPSEIEGLDKDLPLLLL